MPLFQEVHYKKLVKYEEYYFINYNNEIIMNMRCKFIGKKTNRYAFNVVGSTKSFRRKPESYVLDIIYTWTTTKIWINLINTKIYLKINRNYYKEKLIEKFKESALRIILKRIVNEDFEWN